MKLIRSAKIVVLDVNGKALLLRRSNTHPREPLAPDLPGGVIEDGEGMEAGVLRELQEETKLTVAENAIKLLYSLTVDTIPGISVNRFLYGVRLASTEPTITLSYEHDGYTWVDISELVDLERPYQKGIDYANKHDLWREL